VNYTISYRAAHAAAVRYSWVLQDQNPSELILLYNTAQFKKAAGTELPQNIQTAQKRLPMTQC
jgi:hypothetical protein